jgi:hypothetical protein
MVKQHFRMTTLKEVIAAVQPGDWLISMDLKDAYFHIPIRPSHRKFLRFAFQGKVYQFKVLPFGATAAPRLFTKVLVEVMALIRKGGVFIYPFLDDLLSRNQQRTLLYRQGGFILRMLAESGFLLNLKKSHLEPTQDLVYIGARFRTDLGKVFLPVERMESLIACVISFQVGSYRTARQFMQLLGLMAASLKVVPWARLFMRPIQIYLMAFWSPRMLDLDHKILVRRTLLPHLLWWRNSDNISQGMLLNPPKAQCTVTTDASLDGWGGHMEDLNVQGQWSLQESSLHINLLELKAVFLSLKAFIHILKGKVVLVMTDNTTVMSYINKSGGTRAPQLCILAFQMLLWCKEQGIVLSASHIPGVENVLADKLSRKVVVLSSEWSLHQKVANLIFQILGKPHVDLFASMGNQKLSCFCSRILQNEAFATDSLRISWKGLWGYAFPPLAILPLVLSKIREQGATIIVIAPLWPRRSWYTDLLHLLVDFPYRLPFKSDLLSQNKGKFIHHDPKVFNLVAWKLSGIPSLREDFLHLLLKPSFQRQVPTSKELSVAGEVFVPWVNKMVSIPVIQLFLK